MSVSTDMLIVINPISGGIGKEEAISEIKAFCSQNKISHHVFETTGTNDRSRLKEAIKEHNPGILVSAGGDGTVNLCGSVIVNTTITLGIIPLGSGNGFSKDLGIPQNIGESLEVLLHGSIRQLDTLDANGHFFLHLSDIGFNARIVQLYSQSTTRGLKTYAYFAMKEFFNFRPSRYHITTNKNHSFRASAFMITAANTNRFGSNITINPDGKPDDGIFELVIIKNFKWYSVPRLMLQVVLKKIKFSPYSRIIPCTHVIITHNRGKALQVDGEMVGRYKGIEISINPASLKVLMPEKVSP
jgi:diacylglycerol kinase (ATP)